MKFKIITLTLLALTSASAFGMEPAHTTKSKPTPTMENKENQYSDSYNRGLTLPPIDKLNYQEIHWNIGNETLYRIESGIMQHGDFNKCGHIQYRNRDGKWVIDELVTEPDVRQKGVAKGLFVKCMFTIFDNKCDSITINALPIIGSYLSSTTLGEIYIRLMQEITKPIIGDGDISVRSSLDDENGVDVIYRTKPTA